MDPSTNEPVPYYQLDPLDRSNQFVIRNWQAIREAVAEEDIERLAPRLVKLTCDLVSQLDHASIYHVVFGYGRNPDFNWMFTGKKMLLQEELSRLKD